MADLLILFFVALTVIVERLLFIMRENSHREPEVVVKMLESVEKKDIDGAVAIGRKSKDTVARNLVYSLTNREYSLSNAFIRASGQELARYQQGMAVLDTAITAAPMLGLLGTVTGMMRTFAALNTGGGSLSDSAGAITGGVAEALIATCCGLFIAVCCLFPYNYLNARTEQAKQEISDASHALEILIAKSETQAALLRLQLPPAPTIVLVNSNPYLTMAGGGSQRTSGGKKRARIEIIPLIDVIFFLLATFVLFTLALNKTNGPKVTLPDSTSGEPLDPASTATITVMADGTLAWNRDPITMDDFLERLKVFHVTHLEPDAHVLINGDADAPFDRAVYAFDQARRAGINRILIETHAVRKSSP